MNLTTAYSGTVTVLIHKHADLREGEEGLDCKTMFTISKITNGDRRGFRILYQNFLIFLLIFRLIRAMMSIYKKINVSIYTIQLSKWHHCRTTLNWCVSPFKVTYLKIQYKGEICWNFPVFCNIPMDGWQLFFLPDAGLWGGQGPSCHSPGYGRYI